MSYACTILADSLNPVGDRLTTYEVTFPRMVLADLTRHRMLSFSIESTRARPTESIIEQVRENPYVPTFRARAKGMGGGEELSPEDQAFAQEVWRQAARNAATHAETLLFAGKEHVGRMLEPYAWTTGIISGTDWLNFFGLRCPPEGEEPHPSYPAQIELQRLAHMMREAMRESTPQSLKWGEWHLPLVTDKEKQSLIGYDPLEQPKVSAGRCAAVSYLNHRNGAKQGNLDAYDRWTEKLAPSAHWSPGEHPAMAERGAHRYGNFRGFKQLRKFYPGEDLYVPPTVL